MIPRHDNNNLHGADDWIAEVALARRARQHRLTNAPWSVCGRRFVHPRQPEQVDDSCRCILLTAHDEGCVCDHNIERRVYRVDDDGREHYVTRPFA